MTTQPFFMVYLENEKNINIYTHNIRQCQGLDVKETFDQRDGDFIRVKW